MKRTITALFIATVMLAAVFNITVFSASPDPSRRITLTVTVKSGENTVPGGAMTLYRVAELGEDMSYSYTESFKSCSASLDTERELLTSELIAYIYDNNIGGAVRNVDDSGTAFFDSLKSGLYLVVQNIPASGYEKANPFIIELPMLLNNGEYDYDVSAVAKTEPETEDTEKPITTPSTTRPTGGLPQTGQLKWPIPILIVCGLGLIIIGVIVIKSRKNDKDEK